MKCSREVAAYKAAKNLIGGTDESGLHNPYFAGFDLTELETKILIGMHTGR